MLAGNLAVFLVPELTAIIFKRTPVPFFWQASAEMSSIA